MNFNKKVFLSPYFSSVFVFVSMVLYYALSYLCRLKFGVFDIEEVGATEILTYIFYGFGLGVVFCLGGNFLFSPKRNTYFALIFLWFVALLREMGVQHWLTTHDSVVTKTRFFTNPNNPMYEKLIAGALFAIVIAVVAWLVYKYGKKIVTGIIKFKSVDWTILTFAVLAVITQIADRFPANFNKAHGVPLDEPFIFILKILEEGGESLLPLLFAIAFMQNEQEKE